MHRPTIFAATVLAAGLALPAAAQDETLVGTFDPVNSAETRQNPIGDVRVTREGDTYTISMTVDGLSPGMHLAHIHGFAESYNLSVAAALSLYSYTSRRREALGRPLEQVSDEANRADNVTLLETAEVNQVVEITDQS